MKKNNFDGISPDIQALLLPLAAQIEALQQQLDNTVAVKDAEIAHLKEVIATQCGQLKTRIFQKQTFRL